MGTMRERIEKAIADSGKTPSAIAAEVGVSTAAVAQWVSRETKTLKAANLLSLAKATGKSPQWLATGKGPESAIGQVSPETIGGTDVPIIEFATLADGDVRNHSRPAKMAVSWTICPVKHGPRTFAFKMPDSSMACATDQSIPAGHYVWVDPDQADAAHDSPVLARLESGQHLVAQHMEQAGRRWLHLLNPAYPPVPPGTAFEVVGRVIFSGRER